MLTMSMTMYMANKKFIKYLSRYIFSQNCDLCGQTLLFHFISLILPSISLINYDGIIFSERKPYFKPDY